MLQPTTYSRKLDSFGRLVLPKALREDMNLLEGVECPIYKYEDDQGGRYLCIKCPSINQEEYEEAQRIVDKYKKLYGKGDD